MRKLRPTPRYSSGQEQFRAGVRAGVCVDDHKSSHLTHVAPPTLWLDLVLSPFHWVVLTLLGL